MLRGTIPDKFLDFGQTGFSGDACALVLNKMNDDVCGRFLGNAMVGLAFSETTAAHEIRAYQTSERINNYVIKNAHDRYEQNCIDKVQIMVHDFSDVLKEVIVASVETDPVLKQECQSQLLAYDLAVTPFVYKLALFSVQQKRPALFGAVIDNMRDALGVNQCRDRGFSMSEAIEFCDKSVQLVKNMDHQFGSFSYWNSPEVNYKIGTMMKSYNEIEQVETFNGLKNQILEKRDGTAYANSITKIKKLQGLRPTHEELPGLLVNRLAGRYEKNLMPLIVQSGNDPVRQAQAALVMQYCLYTTKTTYSECKEFLSLDYQCDEPLDIDPFDKHEQFNAAQQKRYAQNEYGILHRSSLVNLYGEAYGDLTEKGVCWLPQQGKTLVESAQSNAIQKQTISREAFELTRGFVPHF